MQSIIVTILFILMIPFIALTAATGMALGAGLAVTALPVLWASVWVKHKYF